jgi:hypothetical protein
MNFLCRLLAFTTVRVVLASIIISSPEIVSFSNAIRCGEGIKASIPQLLADATRRHQTLGRTDGT